MLVMVERSGTIADWDDADQLESLLPFGHAQCLNRHIAATPLSIVQRLLNQCANISPDMIFVHYAQVKVVLPAGSKGQAIHAELEAMDLLKHVVVEIETLQPLSGNACEARERVQKLLFK